MKSLLRNVQYVMIDQSHVTRLVFRFEIMEEHPQVFDQQFGLLQRGRNDPPRGIRVQCLMRKLRSAKARRRSRPLWKIFG